MRERIPFVAAVAVALGVGVAVTGGGTPSLADDGDGHEPEFSHPRDIDNRYLPLTKFEKCEHEGEDEGAEIRVVRTLLDRSERFKVDGDKVRVAVIRDKEWEDGELVERTLDYFGQGDNGNVYYFGEDVDDYENGEIVGHDGEWRYGKDTDKLGLIMPDNPRIGDTWRPERVPGIAEEKAKLVNKRDQKTVNGTTYEDVLRVREFQQPADEIEHKLYASGVGNISELPPDGRVDLVGCD